MPRPTRSPVWWATVAAVLTTAISPEAAAPQVLEEERTQLVDLVERVTVAIGAVEADENSSFSDTARRVAQAVGAAWFQLHLAGADAPDLEDVDWDRPSAPAGFRNAQVWDGPEDGVAALTEVRDAWLAQVEAISAEELAAPNRMGVSDVATNLRQAVNRLQVLEALAGGFAAGKDAFMRAGEGLAEAVAAAPDEAFQTGGPGLEAVRAVAVMNMLVALSGGEAPAVEGISWSDPGARAAFVSSREWNSASTLEVLQASARSYLEWFDGSGAAEAFAVELPDGSGTVGDYVRQVPAMLDRAARALEGGG